MRDERAALIRACELAIEGRTLQWAELMAQQSSGRHSRQMFVNVVEQLAAFKALAPRLLEKLQPGEMEPAHD